MSTIIYGGVKYTQIRHAVYCIKSMETIESKYVHDYKTCRCGSVSIDSGIESGNRILGDPYLMENRSVYSTRIGTKIIMLPLTSGQSFESIK